MAIDFEELKREDCRTVARRLGLDLNRQDKVRCFLHAGDKNPSLQIYADGWKCFGCGEHGDAVDLVSKYLGIFKMLRMRRIKQKKNWMTLEILQVAQETVLQSQKGLLLLLLGLF